MLCWLTGGQDSSECYAQAFKERSRRDAFVSDPVKMTVSPNGRYVYVIGSRQITVTSTRNLGEWATSFLFDVYDLNQETRQVLPLHDLYDFGDYLVQIYALDSDTMVILDYNHRQKTLRQRLVKMSPKVAISPMHRCYQYGTSQTSFIKTAVGNQQCAVISRQRFEGRFTALLIPKDPRSMIDFDYSQDRLSLCINRMNDELSTALSLSINHYIPPFFTNNDTELCFLTVDNSSFTIEANTIFCLNLCTKTWYTRQASIDSKSGFPLDEYKQTPVVIDCHLCQNGSRQVALVTRYRTPMSSWRWRICDMLQWIQLRFVRLFFLALDIHADSIGRAILYFTTSLSLLRDRLVLRPYAKLGVLNLNSWKWVDYSALLKDVHYIDQLTDLAAESGHVVSFISQTWSDTDCEQSIRIARSPTVMMSLMSIADFELRRAGKAELRQLRLEYLQHLNYYGAKPHQ